MAPQRGSSNRRTAGSVQPIEITTPLYKLKWISLAMAASLLGPFFLVYLTLRCEKNQCVLFQLPLVVPLHSAAFFSLFSNLAVFGFIGSMFLINFFLKPLKVSRSRDQGSGLIALTTFLVLGLLMMGIAYLRHDYLEVVFNHYLHLLVATTIFCWLFSSALSALDFLNLLPRKQFERRGPIAFFWGTHSHLYVGPVELKSFLYVNVGLVAWGLLDLLILLHYTAQHSLSGPLTFLTVSQMLLIAYSLFDETSLSEKPYKETEGLGFFWLMRVLLYLPFLHSLPVLYASMTEIELPKPVLLTDIVLFSFGFIIYLSALYQKKNFNADPLSHRSHQSMVIGGKRFLISGYWSVVQKPDYLGYMIMWFSWTFACGFSGLSVLVLLVIYGTIFAWQNQLQQYNRKKLGSGWLRYTAAVPKKVIPYVF